MADDKYFCFADLTASERQGEDYELAWRASEGANVVVIAPHGGSIEPFTDKIADAIAGQDFSFYCFKALKRGSNLHISSHLFDEPICVNLVAAHQHVVSIHGWAAEGERVCVGGRDTVLVAAFKEALAGTRIRVEEAGGALRGTDPNNITNRGATAGGVQFELSMDFRRNGAAVKKFTEAVKAVLLDAQSRANVRRCTVKGKGI